MARLESQPRGRIQPIILHEPPQGAHCGFGAGGYRPRLAPAPEERPRRGRSSQHCPRASRGVQADHHLMGLDQLPLGGRRSPSARPGLGTWLGEERRLHLVAGGDRLRPDHGGHRPARAWPVSARPALHLRVGRRGGEPGDRGRRGGTSSAGRPLHGRPRGAHRLAWPGSGVSLRAGDPGQLGLLGEASASSHSGHGALCDGAPISCVDPQGACRAAPCSRTGPTYRMGLRSPATAPPAPGGCRRSQSLRFPGLDRSGATGEPPCARGTACSAASPFRTSSSSSSSGP